MAEDRLPHMCLAAPMELRGHGGMANQDAGPPPNQGPCESGAIPDIDVDSLQDMRSVGSQEAGSSRGRHPLTKHDIANEATQADRYRNVNNR